MARPKSTTLTEGEQRIMEVLWRLGEASVQQVTDELSGKDAIAYTTALTMLRILKDKGYADHRQEGKAHVYRPTVTKQQAQTRALKLLLKRFFNDSPKELAQCLIQDSNVELQELEQLSRRINEAKKKRKR